MGREEEEYVLAEATERAASGTAEANEVSPESGIEEATFVNEACSLGWGMEGEERPRICVIWGRRKAADVRLREAGRCGWGSRRVGW